MSFDHSGKHYHTIRATDLNRDGMGLELMSEGKVVAEIFYSDATRDFTFTAFAESLPLPVIERLISEAKTSLPPADS